MGISAVIITRNEEKNIGRCLASLKGIADEIIVVDAESEDKTEKIVNQYAATFVSKSWKGFSAAKNYGNSLATHSYILSLDADEELSDDLRKSILQEKDKLQGAYTVKRLSNYCGKWIYHSGWYPDLKVRLFPKETSRWEGEFVHEKLVLGQGIPTNTLSGNLLHYTIESIEDHINRINRYSSLAAADMLEKGKKVHGYSLWIRPLGRFFKMYVLKSGWRDGYWGYIICRNSAYSIFLRYAKLRELQQHHIDSETSKKMST